MIIDQQLLDSLTLLAKQNPRLRQAYDLRNSADDQSQRILMPWNQAQCCLSTDIERLVR